MTQTFALPSWIQHTEPPAQSPCQGRFCHSFLIHPPAASAQPARPVTARTVRPEQPGVVLCTSNPFDAAGARPKLYKHSVRVTRLCTDNGEHPSRIRSWWFISIAVALAPVAHPPLPPEAPTAPGPSALFRQRQATAGIPAARPKAGDSSRRRRPGESSGVPIIFVPRRSAFCNCAVFLEIPTPNDIRHAPRSPR